MHSPEYEKQLKEVHKGRRPDKQWGTTGARNFGDHIVKFLEHRRGTIRSVLDFGAGQGRLGEYVLDNAVDIRVSWTNYDPGVAGIDQLEPGREYDLVVSSDVLEHVEPEMVGPTLAQLDSLSTKAQYHHIACAPCGLILPDGRNAHLTVEDPEWWKERFLEIPNWHLMYFAAELLKQRGELRPACKIQLDKV